ncbi:LacI family DNA-binding transcriptional regulator [Sphingobacterium corticis]|uniref:LacI family DNA-binding transcriptional regulator n=1 Tax=Sphingobacterium corticis TaxID=1812823 RepID=A0ABW5NN52_9SPHI
MPNKKKPATIKEIARKLKISTSTVSRALNDHPSIGWATTTRVKKMAEELNYEPNQTAIFFKQRKTFTIGVILPKLAEPFFTEAISSIEQFANERNYTVLLGQSLDDEQRELNIIQTFKKHRVDGLLISLAKNTGSFEFVDILRQSNIPVVFFDRVPERTDTHRVYSDLSTGMNEAIQAFVSRGHKNIALINGPNTLIASKQRLNSFELALKKQGLTFDPSYTVHTDLTLEGNEHAMETLCNLPDRPSAIVSFNDFVMLDVIRYVKTKGIVLNQDMFFISFANYPLWQYMDNPPMGSIEQYPGEQALKAADILFQVMESKDPLPYNTIVLTSKLSLK